MKLQGNYFKGQFHPIKTDAHFTKYCPADLSSNLWNTGIAPEHTSEIVESAINGFSHMRKLSIEKRIELLQRYKEEVLKRVDEIAIAIALEVGKPLWEAKTEAKAVAAKVDVTIKDSLPRIKDKTIENIIAGLNGHEIHKPLGPCFVIGPFNFPCHLANGQILSLLLAGNSIVFKPSEKTIYSAQILIECFHSAGFPKGSVNFVVGGPNIASEITKHKSIKGVFFTGSKNVGLKILENTYTDLSKLVALELGGKNSSIIHEDADIDHTLVQVLTAAYLTTGQRCTSTGNVIVHNKILNEFKDKFKSLIQRIHVDHPSEFYSTPFMSTLIDEQAVATFNTYVDKVQSSGAETILEHGPVDTNFKGHYLMPSLHFLEKFNASSHSFVGEEVFGPHCTIIGYDDLDEAIEIANFTEFGLAGSVFTQSPEIYNKCLDEVQSGIFNLNRSTVGASSRLPFGGIKSSGNYHPAAVSTIDACVYKVASLETFENTSKLTDLTGLKT